MTPPTYRVQEGAPLPKRDGWYYATYPTTKTPDGGDSTITLQVQIKRGKLYAPTFESVIFGGGAQWHYQQVIYGGEFVKFRKIPKPLRPA